MTHHLQVEKQLAAQDAKVVVVAKMAALGEIAASVVHEINNALTVVQGLARRSRREFADNAKVVSAFTQIERSSDRIGQIVKGVSKFSHSSADEPLAHRSLALVIEEAVELCRGKIKTSGISLRISDIPANFNIKIRNIQMSQVFVNLINNAVDAINEVAGSGEAPWISIDCRLKAPEIEVRISNSGPPIPKAIRAQIMEPFFTTKPVGKGTGIGLSISQKILADHGGRLVLDTEFEPTCFVVSLPVDGLVCSKGNAPESALGLPLTERAWTSRRFRPAKLCSWLTTKPS